MKKTKLFASVVALAMTVMTVFSTGSSVVRADEENVTDKLPIDMAVENEVGFKKIAKEDAEVINKAFGYDFGNDEVIISNSNTTATINWENSTASYEDVCYTEVFVPVITRDADGKLVVEKEGDKIKCSYREGAGWWGSKETLYAGGNGTFFDIREKAYYDNNEYSESINTNMGRNTFLEYNDESKKMERVPVEGVYIVRIKYTTDGLGNYYDSGNTKNRTFGLMDFWVLPEGVETVLKLEDIPVEDTTDSEDYTLDLSDSATPVSAEKFAELLTENATKDIVIKSNNNVTFTFAKGTMKAIDGKEAYDFSTTINNAYSQELPSYITQNNFVSQIHFNYSGKLPAEASIRFSVGTQYAGKTLYYYLMNEDKTFAEVQAVTVDAEGYMTVKQNHCSSYVVTTEEPKLQNATEGKNTTPSTVPTLTKGTVKTVSGAKYTVTDVTGNTVEYKAPTSKKKTSLTVPATIKITDNGVTKTYKVTSIAKNAFNKNTKLKSVTIGKNVKTIKANAFSGCSKLKTITLKSTVLKTVGKNTLKGIQKKAVIKCPKKQKAAYKKLFASKTGYKKTMKIK